MQKKTKTSFSVGLKGDFNAPDVEKDRKAPMAFDIADLFPVLPDSSHLLIGTGREDFMATRIAHAVEDVNANLLNMNVTGLNDSENRHIVALRVDHRDPERVARSLERYGYNILDIRKEDGSATDDMTTRLDELMHYLSI